MTNEEVNHSDHDLFEQALVKHGLQWVEVACYQSSQTNVLVELTTNLPPTLRQGRGRVGSQEKTYPLFHKFVSNQNKLF